MDKRPGKAQDLHLDDGEKELLRDVGGCLKNALQLRDWWRTVDEDDAYAERFALSTTFSRPDSSFGFFCRAKLGDGVLPVMGNVQEQFYDRPKTPVSRLPGEKTAALEELSALWMRDQIREFVLRYFMRVSDFSLPEAVDENAPEVPPALRPLAWSSPPRKKSSGFGYEQIFYKDLEGRIGRFRDEERFAIVDLRELRERYAWIILRVEIFDFNFQVAPFGESYPYAVMPYPETSYLVLSPDFVVDVEDQAPGELGRYGFGYAFLPSPGDSILAYGPGRFEVAFQIFEFQVRTGGEVISRMAFAANRPQQVMNLSLDPLHWARRAAGFMAEGANRFLAPFERLPRPRHVDLVDLYVRGANLMTGGLAGRRLGVTKKQLEKDFLQKHFLQHYSVVTSSLITWRQIADWLERDALPEWVESGESS